MPPKKFLARIFIKRIRPKKKVMMKTMKIVISNRMRVRRAKCRKRWNNRLKKRRMANHRLKMKMKVWMTTSQNPKRKKNKRKTKPKLIKYFPI